MKKRWKPSRAMLSRMICRIGRPPISNIGLGHSSVSGRRRWPRPPAISNTQFGRAGTASASSSVSKRHDPPFRCRRSGLAGRCSAASCRGSRAGSSFIRATRGCGFMICVACAPSSNPRKRPRRTSPSVTVPIESANLINDERDLGLCPFYCFNGLLDGGATRHQRVLKLRHCVSRATVIR